MRHTKFILWACSREILGAPWRPAPRPEGGGVLPDGLLQQVLRRLDLLLGAGDRDHTLVAAARRLVDGDGGAGVAPDFPD